MEDIPCTIFNILYVVYGCFNAVAGGEELSLVGKGKLAAFMFATFFSVASGVKKFLEWRGVKGDRRNMESWKEIVENRLVEAKALFDEIKGGLEDVERVGSGSERRAV